MALRRYQHKFLQPLEVDQGNTKIFSGQTITTASLTASSATINSAVINRTTTANFFNSAALDYTGTVESLLVYGNPNVSQGQILHIRNNNVSVNDADAFGGIKFSSSPGADYIIGKNTRFGVGHLEVRREIGTKLLSMDGDGNVTINNGNLVIGTSGKGIDFSATANSSGGSMTSELLSDYEEGTWTPVLTGFTNAGTTSGRIRDYIKIGKQVTIWFDIFQINNNMSFANNATITGFPFLTTTLTSVDNFHTHVNLQYFRSNGQIVLMTAYLDPSEAIIIRGASANSDIRHLWGHVTYIAA